MEVHYTTGLHVQMLISLLKAHGIKKVVVSPGTQNVEFVGSIQQDSFFELYSCVDERSAAYMACGMAADTKESVVITCTEATASRNYLPGLTEAYHRKLPILAVTCLHMYSKIGHLHPQVIDRSVAPVDSAKYQVNIPLIENQDDGWEANLKLNEAILELKHHGNGPVHVNLPSSKEYTMDAENLIDTRVIRRYSYKDELPQLKSGRVAIFIGGHTFFSKKEVEAIDSFCEVHDAVVFCDKTSHYDGRYAVYGSLMAQQSYKYEIFQNINTLIHIGEETADLYTMQKLNSVSEVWRVSEDGALRDSFKKLTAVFEMDEEFFFLKFSEDSLIIASNSSYLSKYQQDRNELFASIPDLPFSNFYIASLISDKFPKDSILHLALSNTIRAWTFFESPDTVQAFANIGCRGIDGSLSTMLGASFVNKYTLFFGVFGDLAFFYDMNCLGNRFVGPNVRIILINNGGGNIFKTKGATAYRKLGEGYVDPFVSATGHFGYKSPVLVKHYSEDLGFEYLTASKKEEFANVIERFLIPEITDKPMLLEIFTEDENERTAFSKLANLNVDYKEKTMKKLANIFGVKKK